MILNTYPPRLILNPPGRSLSDWPDCDTIYLMFVKLKYFSRNKIDGRQEFYPSEVKGSEMTATCFRMTANVKCKDIKSLYDRNTNVTLNTPKPKYNNSVYLVLVLIAGGKRMKEIIEWRGCVQSL